MAGTRRRVAVVGCGRGQLVIALALAGPADVIAGFDADASAIATARRSAARRRVADRVTFEVAAPGRLLGDGYDLVFLFHPCLPPGDTIVRMGQRRRFSSVR